MAIRLISCLVALGLLLGFSATAEADWMRDYDRGLKALEDGDYAEAESKLRSALRDNDKDSHRQRFQGTRFDAYMPHFYAGVAAFKQGRCEDALRYWSNSGMQSVFAKELPELRSQWQSYQQVCDTRLAAASKPANDGSSATGKPATSSPAPTPAAPPKQPSTSSSATVSTSKPAATASAPPARQTPPKPSAAAAPALLQQAAELYFAGRYQELLRTEAQSVSDARARAHALMLRAAAGFILAEQNGDSGGMDDARRDVRAARAAQASLAPDRAAFSPKFIQFWSSTR